MTTTSQEDFIRSLLRITIIQLLKSIGFNKSSNSLIDILTDLYIRYFELLVSKTKRLNQVRDNVENDGLRIQDISQAIDEMALIGPSNCFDLYDMDPINDRYCHLLEHYTFGELTDTCRSYSKPNLKYIRNKRIEDLKSKLNRIGLGGLINSNTYAFSSKTKEEIELEKLLNNEIVINVPEDYLQYLLNETDQSTKQKLKSTFLQDELYEDFDDLQEIDNENNEPPEEIENTKEEEEEGKRQPDYIVFGPTPANLEEYLPYNCKDETYKEFDVAKYLNSEREKNLLLYQSQKDIEFHDEFERHGADEDKGFQLGGW